jgi:hypothetical protein
VFQKPRPKTLTLIALIKIIRINLNIEQQSRNQKKTNGHRGGAKTRRRQNQFLTADNADLRLIDAKNLNADSADLN